jgi:hypothetical protein
MRITDKIIAEGIIYIVLFSVYMIYSDRTFIYKNFWRSYYYVIMYSLPMAMFVTLLPLTYSTLSSLLVWSIIIFFAEMVVFNVVLINAETTDWIKYCTSKLQGYVFAGSIAFLLLLSLFIDFYKK